MIPSKHRDDLNLKTERQVAYYLSALRYLNYITQYHTVSHKLLSLNGDRKLIEQDIFEQLKDNKIFKPLYSEVIGSGQSIKKYKIEKMIIDKYPMLSESTIERRASTIKSWLEWMIKYVNRNFQ